MKQIILTFLFTFQSIAWAQLHDVTVAPTFSDTDCESIQLITETLEINQGTLEDFQESYEKAPENSKRKKAYKKLVDMQLEIVAMDQDRLNMYAQREAAVIGFRVSEDLVIPAELVTEVSGRWEFGFGIENTEGDILLETNWSHQARIMGTIACQHFDQTGTVKRSAKQALEELIKNAKDFEL